MSRETATPHPRAEVAALGGKLRKAVRAACSAAPASDPDAALDAVVESVLRARAARRKGAALPSAEQWRIAWESTLSALGDGLPPPSARTKMPDRDRLWAAARRELRRVEIDRLDKQATRDLALREQLRIARVFAEHAAMDEEETVDAQQLSLDVADLPEELEDLHAPADRREVVRVALVLALLAAALVGIFAALACGEPAPSTDDSTDDATGGGSTSSSATGTAGSSHSDPGEASSDGGQAGDASGSSTTGAPGSTDAPGSIGTTDTGSEEGSGASSSTGGDAPPIVEPSFSEVAAAAGITHVHGILYSPPNCILDNVGPTGPGSFCTPEREVAAAAVGDVDGDGWPDLLATRTHGRPLLYRNQGDGTFVDVSVASGIAMSVATSGAAFGDFDNDGDQDLFLATLGDTRWWFYLNDGFGFFTEAALERGVAVQSESQHSGTSVAVADYDLDGWLDIFVGEWRTTLGMGDVPSHARLLHNRGADQPGWFDDVTATAGVSLDDVWSVVDTAAGVYGFAPGFADLDADRWPDLVVASDFGCSRLFWNAGDGTFVDGTSSANVGLDENGMGSTVGDFDLDGDLDWFVTAITRPGQPPGNKLYRYDGLRVFHDTAAAQGVAAGGWGWGATFFDPDNDGDLELMMTGGWYFTDHIQEPNLLWRNDGGAYAAEIAAAAGIGDISQGRGVVVLDYDADGDEDLYVANNFEVPFLYRNDTGNQHDWLRVRAVGTTSNRDGIGARVSVHVTPTSPTLVEEIGSAAHFMAQSERVAHFGLGWGDDPIAQVEVYWPASDQVQVFSAVARNTELVAVEP